MTRTLIVGLDACDANIAMDMADRGVMPTLASIRDTGGQAALRAPDAMFVGTIWPTLTRGVHPFSTELACWVNVGTDYRNQYWAKRSVGGTSLLRSVALAGHPVVSIDVPHSYVDEASDLHHYVAISEYATHDHHVGMESSPPHLAADLVNRFGHHPLFHHFIEVDGQQTAPDDYLHRALAGTPGGYRTDAEDVALAALIEPSVSIKSRATCAVLAEHPWDLAFTVAGESHAIGHQLWHVHDATHPRHRPTVAGVTGSPIERTYAALDRSLAEIVDVAGSDTTVIVLFSHGMGPHYDATHLLDQVVLRLNQWCQRDAEAGRFGRRLRDLAATTNPLRQTTARAIGRLLGGNRVRDEHRVTPGDLPQELRPTQRFFKAHNNDHVGALRLNLVGREERGLVDAYEADAVLDWLDRQLRSLVNVGAGTPLVRRTYRLTDIPQAAPAASPDPLLPDLFIEWDHRHPIEAIWGPTIGRLHAPLLTWRTGDHRDRGLVLAAGPDVVAGHYPMMEATEFAPSIGARFGVDLAEAVSQPVDWLAGRVTASR